ncbi:sulfide dehydrogenase (flavocytochrome c) cytochrome c subunit [Rhodopseudomonas thermotolerans]|uniref:Sulfide dehydrogenase (Flavocytochrome c) cytochrome c subunit n=2 Tax=Rhodopseudomonas TaxID=1073 RepID=A0A336JRE1_9BRAD|nr:MULTISPECIES: c-type cytochrome [Rhodopseudomonas]RED36109.1 sulfide dehydrogenase (flavocytochrome c) cytochrome c subunit [Rhodopseudomonas pentothenatexigens]REG03481.1 sulfide dehydrogenase (flavocytochrome c) cytochrome c subunit [Rhodopseudomonas thermotolerans]SSW90669.1 sulfide dehydrogenase (flavocytochrome c) cytochrome c subunit [Rhodopseudomonas pentothenatexigens]
MAVPGRYFDRSDCARFPARQAAVAWRAVLGAAAMLLGCAAAGSAVAGGDRELGEYLSSECVTCHQISGRFDGIPSIVGRDEPELVAALTEYRDKVRDNQVMRAIAAKFNDEEIAALASYFASIEKQQIERTADRSGDIR